MYANKLVTTRRAMKTRLLLAAMLWSWALPITLLIIRMIPIRIFFLQSSWWRGIQSSSEPMCPLFKKGSSLIDVGRVSSAYVVFLILFFSIPPTGYPVQEHTSAFDRCDQGGLQDETHAVFLCSCAPKQTNETCRFNSDPMDIFGAVGTVEQAKQPNYLAEGQTPM
eukprot:1153300-Pelagomonas_calceolata.AAC.1